MANLFFKLNSFFFPTVNLSPHHIAALCGNFKLVRYMISKTENKNPLAVDGIAPIHLAAAKVPFKYYVSKQVGWVVGIGQLLTFSYKVGGYV